MKRWTLWLLLSPFLTVVLGVGQAGATPDSSSKPATATAGYWLVTGEGSTYAFNAPYFGAQLETIGQSVCTGGGGLANPAVPTCLGISATQDGQGYWIGGNGVRPGRQTTYGVEAIPQGNTGTCSNVTGVDDLNAPQVGIAAAPVGAWAVTADGGVFSLCGAPFFGSMGGHQLNAPIVGIVATADGQGYWLVASDGGVFAFGDASYLGSMASKPLNQPIVGIASAPDGGGYWLVASDGGVFTFGSARYSGSMARMPLAAPMMGIAANPDGSGYWTVAADGGVFAYGDAPFLGSAAGHALNAPIAGMASRG